MKYLICVLCALIVAVPLCIMAYKPSSNCDYTLEVQGKVSVDADNDNDNKAPKS